jgi:CIC family chloride channel protein
MSRTDSGHDGVAGSGSLDAAHPSVTTRRFRRRGVRPDAGRTGPLAPLLAAAAIGLVGGLAASAFRWLVDLAQRTHESLLGLGGGARVAATVLLPAIGGLVAGALVARAGAPGLGGADEDPAASVGAGDAAADVRRAVLRMLGCAANAFFGGSAGCEGPVCRVGSEIGAWWGERREMPRTQAQVLVACGAAAGLAGLFNAPAAGVIFATETILGGYAIRTLPPLAVAAVAATAVARAAFGNRSAFALPAFQAIGHAELAVYATLGAACGAGAALVLWALEGLQGAFARLQVQPWLKPALAGALVGLVGVFVPQVLGVGYPAIGALLATPAPVVLLATLFAGKLLASALSLGAGAPGGAIAPSLLLGASLGSIVGAGAGALWPESIAPTSCYAMVGLGAMLAATALAPLTGIVLAVELCRTHMVFLPATIAVVLAYLVASAIRGEADGVSKLARRALRGVTARETSALGEMRVSELTRATQDLIADDAPFAEIERCLRVCRDDLLLVVSRESGRLQGVVNLDNVKALLGDRSGQDTTARELMSQCPVLAPSDTLARALAVFARSFLPALPVAGADGRPLGLITRWDLTELCARELLEGYVGLGAPAPRPHDAKAPIPLAVAPAAQPPLSHEVCAVPVPRPFVGKSLRELDLVRRWGVACVGLRRVSEGGELTPMPVDSVKALRAGDVLILIGDKLNVDQIRRLDRASERPPPGQASR